ncbi:MAG: hypothetical protein WC867_01780 [Candidatus Pacearchaeota archaeon]|jgi:hypothetical protein
MKKKKAKVIGGILGATFGFGMGLLINPTTQKITANAVSEDPAELFVVLVYVVAIIAIFSAVGAFFGSIYDNLG